MKTKKTILSLLAVLLAFSTEAAIDNKSIFKESDEMKFQRLTKEIELSPLSETAPETRKWLLKWVDKSESISVLVCEVLGPIPDEKIPYSAEILGQMIFSNASYQMAPHANKPSTLELQIAGIEGALNMYLNILKTHPESRIQYLDDLQERRQSGKLIEYMKPIVAKNCVKKSA